MISSQIHANNSMNQIPSTPTGHVVLNSLFANNTNPGPQTGWANAQAFIGENGSPGGWS